MVHSIAAVRALKSGLLGHGRREKGLTSVPKRCTLAFRWIGKKLHLAEPCRSLTLAQFCQGLEFLTQFSAETLALSQHDMSQLFSKAGGRQNTLSFKDFVRFFSSPGQGAGQGAPGALVGGTGSSSAALNTSLDSDASTTHVPASEHVLPPVVDFIAANRVAVMNGLGKIQSQAGGGGSVPTRTFVDFLARMYAEGYAMSDGYGSTEPRLAGQHQHQHRGTAHLPTLSERDWEYVSQIADPKRSGAVHYKPLIGRCKLRQYSHSSQNSRRYGSSRDPEHAAPQPLAPPRLRSYRHVRVSIASGVSCLRARPVPLAAGRTAKRETSHHAPRHGTQVQSH